jgi:hypothetical protein
MWESENQDESPLMTTDNFHGIDRLDGAPAAAITASSAPWALSPRFGMRDSAVSERYSLARSQTSRPLKNRF